MLGTIIIREIQEYIKSKKLLICLLVTLFLVAFSTVINTRDYVKRNQEYLDGRNEKKHFYSRALYVYKAPQVLSILYSGKDRKLGNKALIMDGQIPTQTTGYLGFRSQHTRFTTEFDVIDYAFIVRIVLSLFVIFLAYNSISEEKIRGTLRLNLSNSVSRYIILVGKFIGGAIVIILSLCIATIPAVLIIILHPSVVLHTSDYIRIIAMFGVSLLYLILFYSLSLCVSVLINKPSIALLALLQLWIVLIIVYPNLGAFIGDVSYSLPEETEFMQQKRALYNEISNKTKGNILYHVRYYLHAEAKYRIDKKYSDKLTGQVRNILNILIFAPSVMYDQLMNRYACTGIEDHQRFIDGIYQYWQDNINYKEDELTIMAKGGKIESDFFKKKYSELPEFIYKSETLMESFVAALPNTLILFMFAIVSFTIAYTAFLRKDVR
ncbi:MAG: ABC transporter permease subunit [Candidatus Latescibacteria bacterium]|jgi:ABC-type transport system involved in multi-copper enzyme maturation permease subunit|nr:ABC transporter permease subunit [Candidatus Latescibacterota bacterium]